MKKFSRRPGVRLDGPKLTYDLRVRGLLEADDVAKATGLSLATVCRALRGDPVTPATALRLVQLRNGRPVLPDLTEALAKP